MKKVAILAVLAVLVVVVFIMGAGVFIYQKQQRQLEVLREEVAGLKIKASPEVSPEETVTPSPSPSNSTEPVVVSKPVIQKPSITKPVETSKAKVQYQTTSLRNNGTYYCFEDRVNELPALEAKAQDAWNDHLSCGLNQKSDYSACWAECYKANYETESSDFNVCRDGCDVAMITACKSEKDIYRKYNKSIVDLLKEICP